MTVEQVCEALEQIAPAALAQSWDNVGLLAGRRDAPVRRVLCCVDLQAPVVDEAVRFRADLVVAYHPPIFRPIVRLVAPSDGLEPSVLRCVAAGMALYALHTAFDAAAGGANDVLARLCGVAEPTPLEPVAPEPAIGCAGLLRRPLRLGSLARRLQRRLPAPCVSIVGDSSWMVRRAVVVVGAAGSLPFQAPLGRGDVVVTGEIRHHDALRLVRVGASAIALSHWSSERPALVEAAARLQAALPTLRVRSSARDVEPFGRP